MKKLLHLLLLIPTFIICQTKIGQDIDGEASNDQFGSGISLSSDGLIVAIAAVGNDGNGSNSGHVRVYENQAGTWTQIGSDINGESAGDEFGNSISLSSDGSIVAIGAVSNDGNGSNSGHVRVYKNQAGVWTQIGNDIDGESAGDKFGNSVSLSSDGSIVAISAIENDGNGTASGHVRVYENQGGVWIQIGNDIDGESSNDRSGSDISLSSDGSIVAIGAVSNDGNGISSGHVRVYENQAGVWTQVGNDIDGESADDNSGFGVSLSSDGSIVAIGAAGNDGNGSNSGHVRVYENQAEVWTQIGNDIEGESVNNFFGFNLSLSSDGSIIAIGAIGNSGNGSNSGHVRVYENQAGVWTQIGNDIEGESPDDNSGLDVSLSSDGSIVAIGAVNNDGNGSNSGHVRIYDLTSVLSSNEIVLSQFNLYPNPTKNQFTIQLNDNLILEKVNIYNSLGQFVSTSKENVITTSSFSSGIFYVEIITDKGKATKKLVIE